MATLKLNNVPVITESGGVATVAAALVQEGTGINSTGESGGNKFLREDGDGTSSWQVAGSPSISDGGNATAITIDSSERVGIGATTPTNPFHVEASLDGDYAGLIHNTDADNGQGLMIRAGADSGDAILSVRNQASNAKMTVLANGNIGIGDTTPQGLVEINNRNIAQGCALFVKGGQDSLNTTPGEYTGIAFGYGGGDTYNNTAIIHEFVNTAAAAKLHLCLNTVNGDGTPLISDAKLTLSGSNVGIGTTAPAAKLDVAGAVFPAADNTHDLGSAAKRWANIYTSDLQMSNIDTGGNDIDGTEGSWTMQEGDENLFLINRVTGKKFKIKLEEIE